MAGRHSTFALLALALAAAPALAQEVDAKDPASVQAYREGFRTGAYKRCLADVELRLESEGKAMDERARAVADKFCGCTTDTIMALIPDAQVEALKTVMIDPALKSQRLQIVTDCARSADPGAS